MWRRRKSSAFVQEVFRLTEDGVDAVFDGIGTKSLLCSYKTLRNRGRLVGYGFGSMTKVRRRQRYQIIANVLDWVNVFALNLLPYRRKVIPYSIQTLKKHRPDWFREGLKVLLNLLKQVKIKPIIAARMPLNEAAKAHKLLEKGSVMSKIVFICNL
ncbi:MAG: zinc-binding dehydrogenase [Nitrososphaeraceae archaeon]